MIAVEVDASLAATLRDRWANVEVVERDARAFPLPREPFVVVANLPFRGTTDLLHVLLDDPRVPLRRADLIVEWAVAVKLAVPWPTSVKGILWSAWYEAGITRRLPRTMFAPVPSVDAGVLVLRRRPVPLVPLERAEAYHRFVAAGFRRGLRAVISSRELSRLAGNATSARELDAHQWSTLFLRCSNAMPSSGRPPG